MDTQGVAGSLVTLSLSSSGGEQAQDGHAFLRQIIEHCGEEFMQLVCYQRVASCHTLEVINQETFWGVVGGEITFGAKEIQQEGKRYCYIGAFEKIGDDYIPYDESVKLIFENNVRRSMQYGHRIEECPERVHKYVYVGQCEMYEYDVYGLLDRYALYTIAKNPEGRLVQVGEQIERYFQNGRLSYEVRGEIEEKEEWIDYTGNVTVHTFAPDGQTVEETVNGPWNSQSGFSGVCVVTKNGVSKPRTIR